ncbi:transposase family protein [Moraxella bovis]|uniref:Uncharacterized protein n=2 Tax=Moraxella bovis TaxID=476 RepID=A0A378PQK2_MORBO|nr:transposase family protein [Moraxella bovis]STY90243.1 Uncharacterised protein [Moraxella bovis]
MDEIFRGGHHNGTEFKGTTQHEFVKVCYDNHINQKFTKVGRPQTNGKA